MAGIETWWELEKELRGHTEAGTDCAWSPDGTQITSASRDKTVRVWDIGREVARLEGHTECVLSCAWSPDGGRLASASSDKTVRVLDANTWSEVATLEGHDDGYVTSCAWSPDSTRLASASDDETVRVWLAPAMTPPLTDGQADNANVPESSLEAFVSHARRWAESRESAAEEAGVANKRARRLEGDAEALQECSLEELRDLMTDTERGRDRVRDALARAESRAAAADSVENAAACSICMTHPKDTALNCWCVHARLLV
jgi:hypothetical protein